ncbi:MAG TPA: flagellar hook capping FlgD N-terminal domain-containing protein [Terriglobia bacterium]|nr:flagellar hook capping FlgD N-terminal domain-containing protein [Terriglobia bacterium]
MDPLTGISGTSPSSVASSSASQSTDPLTDPKNNLGEDQFFNMLITELQNQDPLQPVQGSEFITQLATFSSLEKLTSIESLLKQSLEGQATINQTSQQNV